MGPRTEASSRRGIPRGREGSSHLSYPGRSRVRGHWESAKRLDLQTSEYTDACFRGRSGAPRDRCFGPRIGCMLPTLPCFRVCLSLADPASRRCCSTCQDIKSCGQHGHGSHSTQLVSCFCTLPAPQTHSTYSQWSLPTVSTAQPPTSPTLAAASGLTCPASPLHP